MENINWESVLDQLIEVDAMEADEFIKQVKEDDGLRKLPELDTSYSYTKMNRDGEMIYEYEIRTEYGEPYKLEVIQYDAVLVVPDIDDTLYEMDEHGTPLEIIYDDTGWITGTKYPEMLTVDLIDSRGGTVAYRRFLRDWFIDQDLREIEYEVHELTLEEAVEYAD